MKFAQTPLSLFLGGLSVADSEKEDFGLELKTETTPGS